MYPRLVVDLEKISRNVRKLREILKERNIEFVGVTKLFMGDPKIAGIFRENGVEVLADSRIENFRKMMEGGFSKPFMMIRIPQISRLKEVVELTDHILVSEPEIVKMIDEIASGVVKIYYMVDVGDLREGVMYDKAVDEIKPLLNFKKAKIVGVATNVGCFGGVLPSEENLKWIVDVAKELDLDEISVGGTVYLLALEGGFMPYEITQMRIGEAALLGTDATGDRDIPYLEQETVVLEAEVIEIKEKPSVPIGKKGKDSMGRVPKFEDKGIRRRAILAIGVQDVDPKGLKPLDEGAEVVHASSDHLIVDVTDVERKIKLGDVMRFRTNYSATLRAITSPFVDKVFLG